jgi:hypothetical protein
MPGRIPGRDVRVGGAALLLREGLFPEVRRFLTVTPYGAASPPNCPDSIGAATTIMLPKPTPPKPVFEVAL